MTDNIIPVGPQETITNGSITTARSARIVWAETDLVITGLTFQFQAAPAGTGAVNAFTLLAGRYLFDVKAMTFTGTATIMYRK